MSSIARDFITYARQLSSNGSYGQAIDVYLLAFEKKPQLKPVLLVEFRNVAIKYNKILAAANRFNDIFVNFSRAIKFFPDDIILIYDLGTYLFYFGFYEESWNQFHTSLIADCGYVNAEKNMNSVKNTLIDRWHFRMLNDRICNTNYNAAIIEKIVANKTRVFNLGTGTGILAMYAADAKALSVTACDESKVMTTLTSCILQDNRLLMSVVVINQMSTELSSKDIGHKCSLLVTELFDAGLFGEHVLQLLCHARENLLLSDADVIPQKAEFFIMGIDSELLNSKYHLCQKSKSFLKVNHLNVHIATQNETYDCEDVHLYKDIKYMTEPQSVVKVDFTDLNDIKQKLNGSNTYVVENKVLENGKINAFVGWFNLYLTENISITTDPRNKNRANAWKQAVFYDSVSRNVQKNDIFKSEFFMESERMTMKPNSLEITRISPETLRFLNDMDYLKLLKGFVGMTCVYLGQMTEIPEVNIIDLNPFPFYGLLMAQRGIKSLICHAKTDYDKKFIETFCKANHIDMHNVTILVGDMWTMGTFGETKFHVIFINTVKLCGEYDFHMKEIGHYLKHAHLIQGGLFMPSTVTLMGQIVSSNWLDVTNRVYDQNLTYKVSNHLNKFQVSQKYNLNYTNLEYTPLTDPIEIGICNKLTSEVLNVPVTNDGDANALLCWYKIELMDGLTEVFTNKPYSFVDGIAYLANPIIPMVKDNTANILRCVDKDGIFKLKIDVENT